MGYGGILGQSYVYPVPIPDGGTGATTALGARQNLEVGKTVFGTATFCQNGWGLVNGAYQQTQSIPSLRASMRYQPIIYLLPSGDAATAANEKTAFALLADYGTTGDGTLTLRTSGTTAPGTNFTVQVVGEVV